MYKIIKKCEKCKKDIEISEEENISKIKICKECINKKNNEDFEKTTSKYRK